MKQSEYYSISNHSIPQFRRKYQQHWPHPKDTFINIAHISKRTHLTHDAIVLLVKELGLWLYFGQYVSLKSFQSAYNHKTAKEEK